MWFSGSLQVGVAIPTQLLAPTASLAPAVPCLAPQERERQRALEQKKGALTILDQLAERERRRAASDETRRREGEEMKRRIQALKEEEQRVGDQGSCGVGWGWEDSWAWRGAASRGSKCTGKG